MYEKKICHKCGRELDVYDLQQGFGIHTTCGYGSRYDLSEISLDLCCECFDDLVASCTVSPVVMEG